MTKLVDCVVLKKPAPALDKPPHPGELGERIMSEVSAEGWQKWLERLTMIINENGLSTADASSVRLIEAHMRGFLFGEGELGQVPSGFNRGGGKGK